jgi:hypothetical protein
MKQTFTQHSSFSSFFSTSSPLLKAQLQESENQLASFWVLKNLLAYSAALFVAKTKNYGSYSLLLN